MTVDELVEAALAEDVGDGDVTALATVDEAARGVATITQKAPGVISGLGVAEAVFRRLDPDAVIALPTATIAVMGPEPAINAVYYNRIQALTDPEERAAFVAEQRRIYEEDVDLLRLAADLVIDAVIEPADLRHELVARIGLAVGKPRHLTDRRHGIPPV